MKVEEGKTYICNVCKCELKAVKGLESCPNDDCALSCCGKGMQEKE